MPAEAVRDNETPPVTEAPPTRGANPMDEVGFVDYATKHGGDRITQRLNDPVEYQRYVQDPNAFAQEMNQQLRQEYDAQPRPADLEQRRREEQAMRMGVDPETLRNEERMIEAGWERITVRTQVGTSRTVMMPKDEGYKIVYFRDILAKVEASAEESGGMAYQQKLQDIANVVESFLTRPEYAHYRDIGHRMYEEFVARLSFHSVYKAYSQVSQKEGMTRAFENVRLKHLVTLLKTKELQIAFSYLEKHADAYLRALSVSKGEQFLKDAVGEIERERQARLDQIPDQQRSEKDKITHIGLKSQLKFLDEKELDQMWAMRVAERLWEVMGRKAIHDCVVLADPSKIAEAEGNGVKADKKEELRIKKEKFEKGEGKFKAGSYAPSGMYFGRRLLRFKDWAYTNVTEYRPHLELLEGFEFGTKDYISYILKRTEDVYAKRLRDSYYDTGKDLAGRTVESANVKVKGNYKAAEARAGKEAYLYVSKIFGGVKKVVKKVEGEEDKKEPDLEKEATDSIKARRRAAQEKDWERKISDEELREEIEELKQVKIEIDGKFYNLDQLEWPKLLINKDEEEFSDRTDDNKYNDNVANMDWDALADELGAQGEFPMTYWAVFHQMLPEDARSKIMSGGREAFLNTPNTGTLRALKDVFIYQGIDQYKNLLALTVNYAKLMSSDKAKEMGYQKAEPLITEVTLRGLGHEFGFKLEEVEQSIAKVLGTDLFSQIKILRSYYKDRRFLLGFILGLLAEILKQSFSVRG